MPLSQSLQGSPPWLAEYIEKLVDDSRKVGAEPYVPFRQSSPDSQKALKRQIDRLLASQKGNEFDIIPFSITGTTKPININPDDLRRIIEDEGFAKRIYESATGFHNVSREELQDLRQRATKQFEAFLPEITQFEEERRLEHRPLEADERSFSLARPQRREIAPELPQNRLINLKQEATRLKETIETPRQDTEVNRRVRDNFQRRLDNTLSEINSLESRMQQGIPVPQRRQISPAAEEEMKYPENENDAKAAPVPENSERVSLVNRIKDLRNRISINNEVYRNPDGYSNQIYGHYSDIPGRNESLRNELNSLQSQLRDIDARQPQHLETPSPMENQESVPLDLDLFGRVAAERGINRLQSQRGRIAPMNELHDRSINMLERSFNDDTMQLAADELKEAKRHNELDAVQPLIHSSVEGPSDEYMNKYVNDYTKDMRKALEDESEEEYLKKIAPKINMSFAQMGAFHSGARAKALKDAANEQRTKLHREIAHLTGSARDKAMEHHELKARRQQSGAHLLGHSTKSERDAAMQRAELMRQQAVTKQSLSHLGASALGQAAQAKQAQAQNEINEERQELERQRLHPQAQLERQAAFVHGLPTPVQTLSGNLSTPPVPPNLYNLGGGALSSLASGFGPQQKQYKEGGSVRKKYATGGPIGSDEIGTQIRNIIQEQGQVDRSRHQEALNHNPIQGWLRHVGKEMLANPNEDPLLNLGRGTSAAMDHKDAMHERAANLYDKIQNTCLSQYKVLAEYENMKEKSALNRDTYAEHKRHNMAQEGLLGKKLLKNESSKAINIDGNEFLPISSKKEKQDILNDKKSSESILHELESINKLSKEYEEYNKDLYISPRNPLLGKVASVAQGRLSNITQNKNMRKAAVTKAALDSKLEKFKINMETKMRKGVLPEGMRQFMEKKEVFPSSHEPLDIYNKKLEDLMEETRSVYDASKSSLKYNVHISPYDLEAMKNKSHGNLPSDNDMTHPESKSEVQSPEQSTPYIKVMDPSDGRIEYLSPEEAEIAISRGGVKIK